MISRYDTVQKVSIGVVSLFCLTLLMLGPAKRQASGAPATRNKVYPVSRLIRRKYKRNGARCNCLTLSDKANPPHDFKTREAEGAGARARTWYNGARSTTYCYNANARLQNT